MNRFLKTVLLWVLIAVAPLNAAAAAVGMPCSPAHPETIQLQAAQDGESGNARAKCGVASAFCSGAAAPPPACAAVCPLAGLEIPAGGAAPKVAGFIPDGPERPPRPIAVLASQ